MWRTRALWAVSSGCGWCSSQAPDSQGDASEMLRCPVTAWQRTVGGSRVIEIGHVRLSIRLLASAATSSNSSGTVSRKESMARCIRNLPRPGSPARYVWIRRW